LKEPNSTALRLHLLHLHRTTRTVALSPNAVIPAKAGIQLSLHPHDPNAECQIALV
jgi:hypothetical protein